MSVAALSVKDFIIDISTAKEEAQKRKSEKKAQVVHTYEVVLENNIDFVLNRKTSTTDKSLVFLISQGTFYIQDNKSKDVERLSDQRIRAFFQSVYDERFDKFTKLQWWNGSPKRMLETMIDIIQNTTMQKMYQHGICISRHRVDSWKDAFNNNIKLFKYCYDKCYATRANNDSFDSVLKMATEIEKRINFNNATYFIDKFSQSNVKMYLYEGYRNENFNTFFSLIDTYNLDFNRCVDYLSTDIYAQGIDRFDQTTLTFYKDYLRMQISLFGKIKEKYPKYLKTEHDIVSLKVTTYEKHKKDLMLLNVVDKYKNLEYKDKEFCIILPKTSIDIVDEGINQSHCVASYVDRVATNDTLILFLRKTDEPEKSLVTVEVRNNTITQAAGFANRAITKAEIKFLKKWAKVKEINHNYSEKGNEEND